MQSLHERPPLLNRFGTYVPFCYDDTYQYSVAKYYGLKVVTMDKDFEKIKDLQILFL